MFGVFLAASLKTHTEPNWPVTAYLSGLVLALAWLAVRTGRLGPSIWAHAAFNGLAILAVALQR